MLDRFRHYLIGWLEKRGVAVEVSSSPNLSALANPFTNDQLESLILQGQQYEDSGQFDLAEASYREALQLVPDLPRALLNLGNLMGLKGDQAEAEAQYRLAIRSDPDFGPAYGNLGRLAILREDMQEAVALYRKAIELLPVAQSVEARSSLGHALMRLKRRQEAIEVMQSVLDVDPNHVTALRHLGSMLFFEDRKSDAATYLERLVALISNDPKVLARLAKCYGDMGMIPKALEFLDRALPFDPDDPDLGMMRTFAGNYDPDCSVDQRFQEHLDFSERYLSRYYPTCIVHGNSRDQEKQIRVGYVSADFKEHPVARFVEPLFLHHDRNRFQVHAFSSATRHDEVNLRLKSEVDHWHEVASLSDEAVSKLVRRESIDILIDLSGITDGHRLGIFARKPAPVQATWLGYLGTTGLKTMDYRICDGFTDPPGLTEDFHIEQLARMPNCQWCHMPYSGAPPVAPSPWQENGYITLGAFNYFGKVNDSVLSLWTEVLLAVPTGKLHLAAVPVGRGEQRVIDFMAEKGIGAERICFAPRQSYQGYLASISEVDLALDPFPYNGGTTSFDVLFMGVPLVTLVGDRSISRGGYSILSNLGLTNFIAHSKEEYVEIIKAMTSEPEHLSELRLVLRDKMQQSPLMDGQRFTLDMESLYHQWWQRWCAG